MMKSELLFIAFDAGENNRTFRLNTRIRGVRAIYLKCISYNQNPAHAMTIAFDNMSPAVASENLTGFPVPLLNMAGAPGVHDGGQVFEFPLLLARCNIPSLQTLHVRLDSVDGSAFTHQGLYLWLECRCDADVYDGESVRAEQWLKQNAAMSGVGQHDYRWDYVPSQEQIADNLATLENRFSILSGEKQK